MIKIFLSISKKEQAERLQDRKDDELKNWKLGSLDQKAQELWDKYTDYITTMYAKTGTENSPWIEIVTDDKKTARLEALKIIINALSTKKHETEMVNIYPS